MCVCMYDRCAQNDQRKFCNNLWFAGLRVRWCVAEWAVSTHYTWISPKLANKMESFRKLCVFIICLRKYNMNIAARILSQRIDMAHVALCIHKTYTDMIIKYNLDKNQNRRKYLGIAYIAVLLKRKNNKKWDNDLNECMHRIITWWSCYDQYGN